MIKKFWNLKGAILAFEIAFIFCFFSGISWNSTVKQSNYTQVFNEKSWYYINRGLPTPWSGVSLVEKSVDFPIIKAPFLTREEPLAGMSKYNKIIDLRIFMPLFLITFLASYIFTFIFGKATEKNKSLNKILTPIIIILLPLCIFFYFYWFPRI